MGQVKTWYSPRQRGPVARAGGFLLPPMRAWLKQPHGRRHKAPPQPCTLTINYSNVRELPKLPNHNFHHNMGRLLCYLTSRHTSAQQRGKHRLTRFLKVRDERWRNAARSATPLARARSRSTKRRSSNRSSTRSSWSAPRNEQVSWHSVFSSVSPRFSKRTLRSVFYVFLAFKTF